MVKNFIESINNISSNIWGVMFILFAGYFYHKGLETAAIQYITLGAALLHINVATAPKNQTVVNTNKDIDTINAQQGPN
jgi:hypothetical protein